MAPYQWLSKTDDRFESSRNSKVLSRIRQQNDWTEEQLEEELSNRMVVLQWMLQKNIRSYKEVGKVIADYAVFPEQVLEKAREDLQE
jgi:flagellar protein FlaI